MSGSSQSASEAIQADSVPAAAVAAEVVQPDDAGIIRRLLPWVVSVAVVAWLLWPYRTAEGRAVLIDAFARASGWTFAVALFGTVAIWLTDSYATARTFQRWGTRITLRETTLIRGATALFDAINPALGQAVLTVVVHRRGTPLSQAFVVVLLMNVIFLLQIALISGAGLLAGAAPQGGVVPGLVVAALGLTVIYLIVVAVRPAALERQPTLSWLMNAGLRGHAWAFLYRLPNMATLIGCQVLFMYCFGIELPLSVALFYLPAVMFIVGMPISVQGLGPGQVASVAFFAGYVGGERTVAEATVLACGFAGTALTTLGAVLIGLGCISTATGRHSVAAVRATSAR